MSNLIKEEVFYTYQCDINIIGKIYTTGHISSRSIYAWKNIKNMLLFFEDNNFLVHYAKIIKVVGVVDLKNSNSNSNSIYLLPGSKLIGYIK